VSSTTTPAEAGGSSRDDAYGVLGADNDVLEGAVVTVGGGDWDDVVDTARLGEERIVVNMGPQHPSTHGVLRLILEVEGETVTEARAGIGYLHTGIEKNMEVRSWVQGVTFCTRMDYLSPIFNETAYCLGIEKMLGITEEVPERASVLRVMTMELNRIGSHAVALATGGMELGSTTMMTDGFRERDKVLEILEEITGLRMNHAYVRPGGVAQDITREALDSVREFLPSIRSGIRDLENLSAQNPTLKQRLVGTGFLNLAGCLALGITGPVLRSTGLPNDLRKDEPYCGYEGYDFDVITRTEMDNYSRLRIRIDEMYESVRIVEQCMEKLRSLGPGPVMVDDPKVRWPSQLGARRGRPGELPGPHPHHHGHLHGGAHPPLQARHRGLPGAGGAGATPRWSPRAASSGRTWSPTAAPSRTAPTSATRRSPTCRVSP
jgi:NADH-quinone oxidoreductase subunit D